MAGQASFSEWVVYHEPPYIDDWFSSCWEELQLRIIGDAEHGAPGDIQLLALIGWLNAYANGDEISSTLHWEPGDATFTIDDAGALVIETESFMGRCNPYDLLDQLLVVLNAFIAAHPETYERLLDEYYGE